MILPALTMKLMMTRLHESGEVLPWIDSTAEVAEAIAEGCEVRPPPGASGEDCVAFLVEWSWHESRWNKTKVHDNGAGYGLFGTHEATLKRPVPLDARGQVDAALELFDTSWHVCARHPFDERAAWYASGGNGCSKERGLEISRSRMHASASLLRRVLVISHDE